MYVSIHPPSYRVGSFSLITLRARREQSITANSSMAEEEEIPKSKGAVKWFHDHKGYGFITPDDGGEDLFVHHSSIESDGFRTLREGQLVEFHIALEEERTRAVHVASLDKNPKSNGRTGSKGRYRNGGANAYGSGGDGCYNCGESGHMARDCYQGARGSFNGGGGVCYNCGDYGHMARDCNRGARGGGFNNGSGGACYTCGGQGHMARQCPSGRRFNSGGGGGGGGGGRGCYNCGEDGHFARECPNPTAA